MAKKQKKEWYAQVHFIDSDDFFTKIFLESDPEDQAEEWIGEFFTAMQNNATFLHDDCVFVTSQIRYAFISWRWVDI